MQKHILAVYTGIQSITIPTDSLIVGVEAENDNGIVVWTMTQNRNGPASTRSFQIVTGLGAIIGVPKLFIGTIRLYTRRMLTEIPLAMSIPNVGSSFHILEMT